MMARKRARRGAATVELAFVLPLLILLALACVDFGRFAYYAIGVENAARAGAEYAIMNNYPSTGQSAWTTAVQQAAAGEMAGDTGYDSTQLTVTPAVTVESSGLHRVQVTASYTGFNTVVTWPGIPSNPTIMATVTMRVIR
jgi:Flp pilus assembly protein TadG